MRIALVAPPGYEISRSKILIGERSGPQADQEPLLAIQRAYFSLSLAGLVRARLSASVRMEKPKLVLLSAESAAP